jgi:multiple sugar transport system permease protein
MRRKRNFYLSLERGDLLPTLLMLPTMLLIFFVMIVPLVYGAFLSFFSFDFGKLDMANSAPVLSNYIKFFHDGTAVRSVINSVLFSAGAISGDMVLGTLASVLLFRLNKRSSAILRPVITIPLLVSPIIVGLIWRYVYDPQGILYWFLGLFGIGVEQFPGVTSQTTALLSTIIAHWWQVVPFIIIVLTAGLVSIPQELYEAAHIDGAGSFRAFQMITFPMLKSLYMVILLISGVDTIKAFDIIYSLTGGGPNNSTITISLYAYKQGFENVDIGYAMALSVIAMIVTLLIFGIPFIKHNIKRSRE